MILSRYLTREVMMTVLAVTVVLTLAFISQQFVRYLSFVAAGKIPTSLLFVLVTMEAPFTLAFLLPLGLFLGVFLCLGRLYADQELPIMHMVGLTQARLLRIILSISASIGILVLLLSLFFNPWIATKRAALMTSDEATVDLVQTLIPGRFQVTQDGTHVLYVKTLSRDHKRAQDVFLAQQKSTDAATGQSNWMLEVAEEGYQTQDKQTGDMLFVLNNGFRYEGEPGRNDYKIIEFKKNIIRVLQNDVQTVHGRSEMYRSWVLWQHYADPDQAAELQWRISLGIAALLLGLLAVPFAYVPPRQNRYMLLLPAIFCYVIYINLLYFARHAVEKGSLPISVGMWWVHLLLLTFILILIRYRKGAV